MQLTQPYKSDEHFKLESIDVIRGIAIILVITAHAAGVFKELPWPIKKLTNMGWYGVQLFFIASAFTLLLSWNYQVQSKYRTKVIKFYIRRYMRIAPMYYFGVMLYLVMRPPYDIFDIKQLLTNMLFMNAWSPATMTTMDKGWQVVPGGWSIGVEFGFYILFPMLAVLINSIKKGILFCILSIFLGCISYLYGKDFYVNNYAHDEVDNFLFFWLPNQLFVFSLGILLYFFYKNTSKLSSIKLILARKSGLAITIILFCWIIISQIGMPKHFSTGFPWLPAHYVVSCLFFILCLTLLESVAKYAFRSLLINFGRVSFSAYVIHFAVIQLFELKEIDEYGEIISVFLFGGYWGAVLSITYIFSLILFRYIEQPFINMARNLCAMVR